MSLWHHLVDFYIREAFIQLQIAGHEPQLLVLSLQPVFIIITDIIIIEHAIIFARPQEILAHC